jgi:hypothetical protein
VRGFGRTVDQLRAQWGVASLPKQQQQQQHPPTVHKKKKKKKKLRGRESVLPFVEKNKKTKFPLGFS